MKYLVKLKYFFFVVVRSANAELIYILGKSWDENMARVIVREWSVLKKPDGQMML